MPKKNWIQYALKTKSKGALHRALGVKSGDKIPEAKVNKATKSSNPRLVKMANMAKTLRGFRK